LSSPDPSIYVSRAVHLAMALQRGFHLSKRLPAILVKHITDLILGQKFTQ
jgi:hypothetical protein